MACTKGKENRINNELLLKKSVLTIPLSFQQLIFSFLLDSFAKESHVRMLKKEERKDLRSFPTTFSSNAARCHDLRNDFERVRRGSRSTSRGRITTG